MLLYVQYIVFWRIYLSGQCSNWDSRYIQVCKHLWMCVFHVWCCVRCLLRVLFVVYAMLYSSFLIVLAIFCVDLLWWVSVMNFFLSLWVSLLLFCNVSVVGKHIPHNSTLASFDITNLYTNITTSETLQILTNMLKQNNTPQAHTERIGKPSGCV